MNEVFAGRYELVDALASGGAGTVWRVWDHRDRTFRAGKVLKQSDSASLMRFVRETRSRIHHPHVVAPLGWVGEDDRVMFTMPLIHGGSLSTLIKDYGPLPPAWALEATDQLLDALGAIHAAGLVHRDVKTSNILLVPGPVPDVQLIDFGIAAPVGDPRLTRDTQVIGTPGYMSPEARMGADPDPKQDLYSAGVVLWELLTGSKPPREGDPEIPAGAAESPLGRVVARLLADEPDRFATATEAQQALRECEVPPLSGEPIVVFDQIPPPPADWQPAANPWHAPVPPGAQTMVPPGAQLSVGSHVGRPAGPAAPDALPPRSLSSAVSAGTPTTGSQQRLSSTGDHGSNLAAPRAARSGLRGAGTPLALIGAGLGLLVVALLLVLL